MKMEENSIFSIEFLTGFFGSCAQACVNRFLNHWLQPYLEQEMKVSFTVQKKILIATITDCVFSSEKLNEVFSSLNLPVKVKQAKVAELNIEIQFFPSRKFRIVCNGLEISLIFCEQANSCILLDSMLDSYYEHQDNTLDESLTIDEIRYDSLTAHENSKKFILSLNDLTDILLMNTTIRFEQNSVEGSDGIAVKIQVGNLHVYPENLKGEVASPESAIEKNESLGTPDALVSRCITIKNVKFFTDEFTIVSLNTSLSEYTSHTEKGVEINSNLVQFVAIPIESTSYLAYHEVSNTSTIFADVNVVGIQIFITPRQVFLLSELLTVFSRPKSSSRNLMSEPLTTSDYEMLERQQATGATTAELGPAFQSEFDAMSFGHFPNALGASGWSVPQKEHHTNFEDYHDDNILSEAGSYFKHNYAQSVTSDSASVVTKTEITQNTQAVGANSESMIKSREWMRDPSSHVMEYRLKFRLDLLCAVVLHEDVIVPDGAATFRELNIESNNFFNLFSRETLKDMQDDVSCQREVIRNEFPQNHFQFVSSSLSLDVTQSQDYKAVILKAIGKVDNLELIESVSDLNSLCIVELVTFSNNSQVVDGNPCLNLSYLASTAIRNKYNSTVDSGNTKSDVSIAIASCSIEVDLSLIDRAEAFFHSPRFTYDHNELIAAETSSSVDFVNESLQFKNEINVSCSCSSIDIKLRFPIPDLRSRSDVLTKEIWKRNVRSDILTLRLDDVCFGSLSTAPVISKDEITLICQKGLLLFQENASECEYKLAEISVNDENLPMKVVLLLRSSDEKQNKLKKNFSRKSGRSVYCKSTGPSLFFEKNYVHSHKQNVSDPLLQPVDVTSFDQFIANDCSDAQYRLHGSFPYVKLFLPSKHIYELIYNRLAYDLILWQPHSSHPLNSSPVQSSPSPVVPDSFLGTSMTDSIYYSFSYPPEEENKLTDNFGLRLVSDISSDLLGEKNEKTRDCSSTSTTSLKTLLALTLKIGEGSVELRTPYVNLDGTHCSMSNGRIILDVTDVSFHVAAAYNGDPNKTYVGIYSKDVLLAHHSLWSWVDDFDEAHHDPEEMSVVIKRCPNDFFKEIGEEPLSKSGMLSLVMEFDFDEVRNVNTMCLAGKLSQALYRFEMHPFNEMWVMQLQDMFAVQDYPINGYEMPEVVNDIHFQLGNCMLSYKPEKLRCEAVLFVGALIFSSSLSYSCDTSIFRMINEDASFYLRKQSENSTKPMSARIMESNLLQITIRQVLRQIDQVPDREVIVVGGLVTVNTCTDSLIEMLEFVGSFTGASEDGIIDQVQIQCKPAKDEPLSEEDQKKISERKQLLAEAIVEIPQARSTNSTIRKPNQASPFVFPDDRVADVGRDTCEAFEQLDNDQCSILDMRKHACGNSSHEVAVNMNSAWPSSKISLGKVTKRRKTALTPVLRWNIKEISLCWKLCQGLAFSTSDSSCALTAFELRRPSRSPTVSYSAKEMRLAFNTQSPAVTRKDQNVRVNHIYVPKCMVEINVRALRYAYEEFSDNCPIVCGHDISAKDIEILDLVPSSNLRKLLCRYVTDEYPIGQKSDFLTANLTAKRRPSEKNSEEFYLDVSVGNIRMYIDQTTAGFLIEYFKDIATLSEPSKPPESSAVVPLNQHVRDRKVSDQCNTDARKPFFKSVVFNPAVVIVIDFEGNFSDISSFNELIIAMASANKLQIKLKEINFKRGILGIDRVIEHVKNEWVNDICQNQKMGLVKLFAPIGHLMDIIGGMWQLLEIPFQQYMKDGNIFRGIMIGSQVFTCRSMSATFGLLGKFFNCLENVASFVMVVVSPNHRVEASRAPPPDAVSGVVEAGGLVRDGVLRITGNVIASTRNEGRERGVGGALSGFTRHIPEIVCTPPLLATQVTGVVLRGLHQQWTPGNEQELQQKYK